MDSDTVAELNRIWLIVYGVSMEGEYCVTGPRLERRVYDYTTRGRCGLMKGKSVDRPILTSALNLYAPNRLTGWVQSNIRVFIKLLH